MRTDRLARLRRRFEASDLPFLELEGLGLDVVPDWVVQRDLVTLSLKGNALRALPAEIALLTGLEELVLSGNRFEEVPPVVRELRGLTELYLDHNTIRVLPEWLGELPALRWVQAVGNPLASVPTWENVRVGR
ncbi:MAG: leucine-rich repeat domain-containing protein [Alphaproteobacteria bacterium]|nr:leucine-rich repeat domain-containing protein [Alphaproteobacteria bacterium]